MGLGGITRDSIVDLNKLVHVEDHEERPHARLRSHEVGNSSSRSGRLNKGERSDELGVLQRGDMLESSDSQESFEAALNDCLDSTPPTSRGTSLTTLRSSGFVATATSYNHVSATNSRPLDSYRPTANGPTNSNAQAYHYQDFNYESFADYYSDSFVNDDCSSLAIGRTDKGNTNFFCCMLAPWGRPKAVECGDASVSSRGQDREQDGSRHGEHLSSLSQKGLEMEQSASLEQVSASPTLTSTQPKREGMSAVGLLGLGEKFAAIHSQYDDGAEKSDVPNPKTSLQGAPSLNLRAPLPYTKSNRSEDSVLSNALCVPDESFNIFDEKKQEDGDVLDNAVSPNTDGTNEKEHGNDMQKRGPPPIKSIMKVRWCATAKVTAQTKGNMCVKESTTKSSSGKRHLFPTYELRPSHSPEKDDGVPVKKIDFNPMARVLTIPSRKDIPLHHKAQIWWQKCDYDEFKKTGRIISKAMECGGSEIWLASSNAWGDRAARQASWSCTESPRDKEEYNKALSKYVSDKKIEESGVGDNYGSKWWCKFGHSRRGLEHIASSSEGKARQSSVLLAIRMVMEEQRRQRSSRTRDPNKLRNVAMQYTSWARDLALAAGTADEEAVASGFDPAAKCRAHHLAKRLNVTSRSSLHSLKQSDAGGGVAMAVTSQILDENTHSKQPTVKSSGHFESNHNLSDCSLSKRAKGFIPGGEDKS